MNPSTNIHFHIRWFTGALDWERHSTRVAALKAAIRLARPGEKYSVEEGDEKCRACMLSLLGAEERASG
jgi:hypothetical protein